MRLSFFLMGNIACAVLYRYYKHRSLLNGFVHTCLKLWDIGGGGVGFFWFVLVLVLSFQVDFCSRGIVSEAFNYWKILVLSSLSYRVRQM